MSRQTPRKARHIRQPSNRIPAVSDYESDAAAFAPSYPPPPTRTNTELNLGALQRYIPSIHTILSIAANAVVYTIDRTTAQWVKSIYEGTMFVCAQAPLPSDPAQRPRACVFILNRRGLENVVIDLARVSHAEADELVSFKIDALDRHGMVQDLVLGVWIHSDKEDTRENNWAVIEECWRIARSVGVAEGHREDVGPATWAIGRRLSLDDLLARQAAGNVAG